MINEGINVSGFTGCMSFRDLGEIQAAQTCGRAMRPLKIDRDRLYDFTINAADYNKKVKPYAWIVVPEYSEDQGDMRDRMMRMAKLMREDLGYIPFEDANGSPSDGRQINFTPPDQGIFGKTPDEMSIIHEFDEPEILMLLDKAKNSKSKTVKKMLKRIFVKRNRGIISSRSTI